MLLNQNFLSIKQLQMMNLQLNLTRIINSCTLITCDTKYLKKLIYNLVKRVLKALQNFLNFYFWVLTVIDILRVYLVQSEIPALMGAITCYTKSQDHATQGHGSASKYTETSFLRNYLFCILIPKINILGKKKLACYEWKPRKSILAPAKSSTYKTLQAQKNQKQAAANEEPEDWTFIIIFVNNLT